MRNSVLLSVSVFFLFMLFSCDNTVRNTNDSNDVTVDESNESDEDSVQNDSSDDKTDLEHTDEQQDDVDYTAVNDEMVTDDSDLDSEVPDSNGDSCTENSQCGEESYCYKDQGMCFAEGVCQGIPDGCTEIYFPVCGCDDSTYDNDCFANAGSTSVFYSFPCLKELESGIIDFSYTKGLTSEEMSGGVSLKYSGFDGEILILSTPESENNENMSYVTVNFTGANGLKVVLNFNFQREPFVLPQQFDLERDGDNKATILTDSGLTVGYLTGKLEVSAYQKQITGDLGELVLYDVEGLQFVE